MNAPFTGRVRDDRYNNRRSGGPNAGGDHHQPGWRSHFYCPRQRVHLGQRLGQQRDGYQHGLFGKTNNVTTSLGSAHSAPFTVTAANLAAGSYSLTAVATAAGISGTSAVVNITPSTCRPNGEHYQSGRRRHLSRPGIFPWGHGCREQRIGYQRGDFFATDATSTDSLGSAQASPFNITAGSLAAGNYSLIAVATAAGVSTTSSAVNVSVVSPVAISNSVPVVAGGHFSFNYSANVGLTYVVQRSSDLINWPPVSTNVASNNPVHFTDSVPVNGSAFYRVARSPTLEAPFPDENAPLAWPVDIGSGRRLGDFVCQLLFHRESDRGSGAGHSRRA